MGWDEEAGVHGESDVVRTFKAVLDVNVKPDVLLDDSLNSEVGSCGLRQQTCRNRQIC